MSRNEVDSVNREEGTVPVYGRCYGHNPQQGVVFPLAKFFKVQTDCTFESGIRKLKNSFSV